MTAKSLVLAALMTAGCAASDRVLLVTSTALIACDIGQTATSAHDGWRESRERNPVILNTNTEGIVMYGTAGAALNAWVWAALPTGWRTVYGVAVSAAEMWAINDSLHRRYVCFGDSQQ